MQISVEEAQDKFSEILHRLENGENFVVTRHGRPVANFTPLRKKHGGIDFAALEEIKRELGVDNLVSYIAPDFDDPLPEDFLITRTTDQQ